MVFKSDKQRRKSETVSRTQKKRWVNHGIGQEHLYNNTSVLRPDISVVTNEEIVDEDCNNITPDCNSWRDGRRVVELGVLADALSGCEKCGLPLALLNCVGISTHGLAATLKVICVNDACKTINLIPTGKRHDNIWDVNTKLAAATIHAGIGERQVNGFLAALNIPPVSHKILDNRQEEIGSVIEEVVQESMQEWTEKEKALAKESCGIEAITVAVDAGWQKRGSGRSYDSLTGHCSMIGTKTGKILDYKVRSKSCRICSIAKKGNKIPRVHKCRKNYCGSAKSMESDMVVEMLEMARSKGTNITTIVGDEDSTTIARIRTKVDKQIRKLSDSNHIKKTLGKSLYALKTKHSRLSTKIINYLMKCFNFMVAQFRGKPEEIKNSLPALSKHPFGDHSSCSSSWCRHLEDPSIKFTSLPYGRPLKDKSLQESLSSLFSKYIPQSEKLSKLESTQGNESFNNTVASKAPKTKHYGSSGSLSFRLAASAVQKNSGQKYLVDVNRAAGLSPGTHTLRLTKLRDEQAKKRKALANTRKWKLRRVQLKKERNQATASTEVREGICYEPGIDMEELDYDDITEMPPPKVHEKKEFSTIRRESITEIFFDTEATGFRRDSHIIQMAAKQEGDTFNRFVLPTREVSQGASEVTGMTFESGELLWKGNVLPAIKIRTCLNEFIQYLEKSNNNVLIGHNIKNYDCMLLYTALDKCNLLDKYRSHVLGYVDTMSLFKLSHPGLDSYSQTDLFEVLRGESYKAHLADEDVNALFTLVNHNVDFSSYLSKVFIPEVNILNQYTDLVDVAENMPSLQVLINSKALSSGMARTVARSGLCLRHLKLAYSRNGEKGIFDLFTEKCGTGVRVTKSSRIIQEVSKFLSKMN